MFSSSCLPDLLPPLLHHVCMVVLEDHLHQTCQPLQRGTITHSSATSALFYMSVTVWWHKVGLNASKSLFVFAPVLPAQGWEGALREGGEARVSAGDFVEGCHQPAPVHPHRSWRYVTMCVCVCVCLNMTVCWHPSEQSNNETPVVLTRCSNPLLWPLSSYQARPLSSLLRVRHVRKPNVLKANPETSSWFSPDILSLFS